MTKRCTYGWQLGASSSVVGKSDTWTTQEVEKPAHEVRVCIRSPGSQVFRISVHDGPWLLNRVGGRLVVVDDKFSSVT
jgi:hypothetical protein